MDLQDQMLCQYFIFLKETVTDRTVFEDKVLEAVDGYLWQHKKEND